MLNATVKSTIKRTTAAIVFAALAASAIPAAAGAQAETIIAAKQSETILVPSQQAKPGCWSDNGYGRMTSCDAG